MGDKKKKKKKWRENVLSGCLVGSTGAQLTR